MLLTSDVTILNCCTMFAVYMLPKNCTMPTTQLQSTQSFFDILCQWYNAFPT
jgi:glutamate/tyrosine decarboxylase-like PLP-dependent enzyme